MTVLNRPPPNREEAEALNGLKKGYGDYLKKDLKQEPSLPPKLQALLDRFIKPMPDPR